MKTLLRHDRRWGLAGRIRSLDGKQVCWFYLVSGPSLSFSAFLPRRKHLWSTTWLPLQCSVTSYEEQREVTMNWNVKLWEKSPFFFTFISQRFYTEAKCMVHIVSKCTFVFYFNDKSWMPGWGRNEMRAGRGNCSQHVKKWIWFLKSRISNIMLQKEAVGLPGCRLPG